MKTEKNNIERLFKDKLQELEVTPSEHLWANISQEIAPKKERKKPFLFWYIGSGIAASFLIFIVLFFNSSNNTNNNTLVLSTENEYCPEDAMVNTHEDIQQDLNDSSLTINTNNTGPSTNDQYSINKNLIVKHGGQIVESNKTITQKNNLINNYTSAGNAQNIQHLNNNHSSVNLNTNNAVPPTNDSYSINKNLIVKHGDQAVESNKIITQKNNSTNNYTSTEIPEIFIPETTKPIATTVNKKPTNEKSAIIENETLTDTELAALLQSEEEFKEEIKNEKQKRWSLQPQLTTFSYNNTNEGSSINSNFKNNPQNTETDISYGIRIAYQATPKVSIRTGLNNANIRISTSNIGLEASSNNFNDLFSNDIVSIVNLDQNGTLNSDSIDVEAAVISEPEPAPFETLVTPSSESGTFETLIAPESESIDSEALIDTDSESGELTDRELETPRNNITSGKISQQIQYLEIPFEVTYKVLDKKIGINLIGGFSAFLLTKNESSFINENNRTLLGETSNINKTSFSSNIGFSADYNLIKNLTFSIEPILKFQFNSIENSTEYKPYFIGVSSGLRWNF